MALQLGILISGNGSNLQAIVDAIAAGKLDATVKLVVSSRVDAFGLKRAERAGIPTLTISRELYDTDPLAADTIIANALHSAGVDYVAMAGYMRMVRAPMLSSFPNRIVNLHPALLPSFRGAHAIADAYNAGVKVTGVTVHFADEHYDRGPIIAQRAVPVAEGCTIAELENDIHAVEHELYPSTLQLIAQGRVRVGDDGRVHIS